MLPNYDTPQPLNVSGNSRLGFDMVDDEWNSQVVVNFPVTSVQRCISTNPKTLGLEHHQLTDTNTSRGAPDGVCLVHHWRMNSLYSKTPSLIETTPL
jgi:hypothetical protein